MAAASYRQREEEATEREMGILPRTEKGLGKRLPAGHPGLDSDRGSGGLCQYKAR